MLSRRFHARRRRWASEGAALMRTLEDHLFGPGPKRILALDGGGVRGLISLGILKKLEDVLRKRAPEPDGFRLSDYFDLIAGTSTGSIIASALALGWSVDEVKQLYDRLCPALFPQTRTMGVLKFRRSAEGLATILNKHLGDMTLGTDRLKTGLLVCAKRIDTDSAWILTNNPRAKFWTSTDGSFFPNRDYKLAMVVRASAAAPTYFEPVKIVINDGRGPFPKQEGLFVDGAISGHNNPALQAVLTATLPSYGFGWQIGLDAMLVTSVGTGWRRERHEITAFLAKSPASQAVASLTGMINDSSRNDLMVLQALSEPSRPWPINAEVEGLVGERIVAAPLFRFQRYDAVLSEPAVTEALSIGGKPEKVRKKAFKQIMEMDCGDKENLNNAYAVGLVAGSKATGSDFPAGFDITAPVQA